VHDTKPPFLEGFVVDMSKQVRSAPGRCEDIYRWNMLQPIGGNATHWWQRNPLVATQPNSPLRCAARLSLFV
jgi:hypothetical protein